MNYKVVTRGKIRGNGAQLAAYLLTKADNDNVHVFDIRGTSQPNDLRKSLLEMSLTSELTKSDQGLYHVQICPAYGDDKKMTREDWLRAAGILEEETGYAGQKRVMVMHEKKGRLHLHVAYERYDHEKGIMKSDSFSRLAQDRARIRMEQELELQRTPERNKHRPELKEEVTKLWQQTVTAQDFMKAIDEKGYAIATGTERPYMIVDHMGRSFNLVRQLTDIKTKEVRERFKKTKLMKEKEAIQTVRNRQEAERLNAVQEKAIDTIMLQQERMAIRIEREASNDNDKAKAVANDNVKSSPVLSLSMEFKVDETPHDKVAENLKKAVEKEKTLQKIRENRLKQASLFRENEREL